MKRILFSIVLASAILLGIQDSVQACQILKATPPEELITLADVIVRATAESYEQAPEGDLRTTGLPKSTIKFKVVETLKGKVTDPLLIFGYLSDKDDYNDKPAPFTFIRPGGRAGSCIANTYKKGADFLLFLKLTDGKLTPYWSALMPVNEQLRSSDDAWLEWVKEQLKSTPGEK